MIDKELIEFWRKVLKPTVSSWLYNINYEHVGEQDKEEFERDFDEILDLALVGLKYKAQLSREDATSDLIDRQAAIDALGDKPLAWTEGEYELGLQNQWQSDVDALKVLPSAQPEPHEGHWIKHIDLFDGEQYECSRCGVLWVFNDGTPEDNEAYFCPNCGADMRLRGCRENE